MIWCDMIVAAEAAAAAAALQLNSTVKAMWPPFLLLFLCSFYWVCDGVGENIRTTWEMMMMMMLVVDDTSAAALVDVNTSTHSAFVRRSTLENCCCCCWLAGWFLLAVIDFIWRSWWYSAAVAVNFNCDELRWYLMTLTSVIHRFNCLKSLVVCKQKKILLLKWDSTGGFLSSILTHWPIASWFL